MKTMQKVQRGFTLIELMIVVAIIGILAALAIPAYTDYTIRSKVSEGASLSGAVKTAVEVYYSENGTLPGSTTTAVSLGISQPSSYNAKYVASVSHNLGQITVNLNTMPELGTATGGTVIYTPTKNVGNLEWRISGSIPPKYLPRT